MLEVAAAGGRWSVVGGVGGLMNMLIRKKSRGDKRS